MKSTPFFFFKEYHKVLLCSASKKYNENTKKMID